MSGLAQHDPDGGGERCRFCSALAAGPCARCRAPVCGDCCVLTEGGVQVWAVCLRCEKNHGTSLTRAWLSLGGWLVGVLFLLAAAVAAAALLAR